MFPLKIATFIINLCQMIRNNTFRRTQGSPNIPNRFIFINTSRLHVAAMVFFWTTWNSVLRLAARKGIQLDFSAPQPSLLVIQVFSTKCSVDLTIPTASYEIGPLMIISLSDGISTASTSDHLLHLISSVRVQHGMVSPFTFKQYLLNSISIPREHK